LKSPDRDMRADYQRNVEEKTNDVIRSVLLLQAKSTELKIIEGQEKLRRTISFPECTKILKDYFYLEIVPDKVQPDKAVVRAFADLIPLLHDYIVDRDYLNNRLDTFSYKPNSEQGRPHPDIEFLEKIARSGISWSIEKGKEKYEISPLKTFFELSEFENGLGTFCFFKPQLNLTQLYLYAAHQSTQLLGIWKNEEPFGILPLLLMQMDEGFQVLYLETAMSLLEISYLSDEDKNVLVEGSLDILPEYATLLRRDPYYLIGDCRKTGSEYDPIVKTLVETAAKRFSEKIKIEDKPIYPESGSIKHKVTVPYYDAGMGLHLNCDGLIGLHLPEDQQLLSYLQQHGYPFSSIFMFSQAFLQDKKWQKRRLWKELGEMEGRSEVLPDVNFHKYFIHHLEKYHDTAENSESNLLCG